MKKEVINKKGIQNHVVLNCNRLHPCELRFFMHTDKNRNKYTAHGVIANMLPHHPEYFDVYFLQSQTFSYIIQSTQTGFPLGFRCLCSATAVVQTSNLVCFGVKLGYEGVGGDGQLTATLLVILHVWLSSSIYLPFFTFLSLGSWFLHFNQCLVVGPTPSWQAPEDPASFLCCRKTSFLSVPALQSYGTQCLEDPCPRLKLCCCHLEILNDFMFELVWLKFKGVKEHVGEHGRSTQCACPQRFLAAPIGM